MAIDPLVELGNPNELHFNIPFVQYLRPDGRARVAQFSVLGDTAVKAKWLFDVRCRFECEVLTTGEVSLTVCDPDADDGEGADIAIEVVPNGPEVPGAIDRLVLAATVVMAKVLENA